MHVEALDLREVIVFLVAAGIVVPLIHRLRVSPVLGFLIVGIAIGPHGLALFIKDVPWLGYVLISDLEGVQALAELGVVFLLFMIGLELSGERLWAMRHLVFGLGGAQVLVSGAIIAAIALLFDNTLPAAMVLGGAFALSSTAIVMQLLTENQRLGTRTGKAGFSILLFQDLAVVPILFTVGAFATQSDESVLVSLVWAIGQALIAIVIILLAGRLLIRPLFRFVGSTASREMFLALVLLVIIGTALATQMAGLSMALGAFLAGLLFAETEYRHEVEVDIEPFKGLLLGLFFVGVGMSIDLVQIAADPFWLITAVIGLFVVKGLIIYVLVRIWGEPRSVAVETALLLGQGGEFAFVVVGMATAMALIPGDTAQFMLIVAGITMVATPPVAHVARRIGQALETRETRSGQTTSDPAEGFSSHVVIVGYGRVGHLLGTFLDQQELPYIALDIDLNLVKQFHSTGASVYYGDATRPDMLQKCGVERALALVVTMDNPAATERVVVAARQHWPDIPIYARARDVDDATHLIVQGASHAVPETTEASLRLSEMVLEGAGVPDRVARRLIEARRKSEQAAVDESRQKHSRRS